MITELCVACLALLFWVFLPDGLTRNAAFALATTSWFFSLMINLNPFTRFDGYFILSDLVRIDNLQPRAFAHMRWRLRQLLFSPDEPAPEHTSPGIGAFLTIYGTLTTLYRLFLYIGIALLVYHFTVKIIGVLLFLVEIWAFILRPVRLELRVWARMRGEIIRSPRSWLSLAILAGGVTLLALPLSTTITIPALMTPERFARIYAGETGRIEEIHVSLRDEVKAGAPLLTLSSAEIAHEITLAEAQIRLSEARLARAGASAWERAQSQVVASELARHRAALAGLQERAAHLTVRAPVAGCVCEMNPELAPGRWLSGDEQIAYIAAPGRFIAHGYLREADFSRLSAGANGRFIPDDLSRPGFDVALEAPSPIAADQILFAQITSPEGGKVMAERDEKGRLIPKTAQHLIRAIPQGELSFEQTISGVIKAQGRAESLLSRAWRRVMQVLIREMNA